MNKRLPLYILAIYFVFVIFILIVQLAGREDREFVAVGFNDRLDNAVAISKNSPLMLKQQKLLFIDDENTSFQPVIIDGITYLPLNFYKNGFGAITSYNESKAKATIKYDNKALVLNPDETKATLSDAERDRKIELSDPPAIINGSFCLPVRAFADIFDFELFYDDGLIIISNMKDIFNTEKEVDSIEAVRELVCNLPIASSYDKIKELVNEEEAAEEIVPLLQTEDDSDLYIICKADYVYFINDGKLIKADNMPYGDHNELCSADLPEGFTAKKIQIIGDFACVSGERNGRAAFCVFDMNGEYGDAKKYVSLEGRALGVIQSEGYMYFASLSDDNEDIQNPEEEGYIPTVYDTIRYFPELNGSKTLNVYGVDMEDLTSDGVLSSFFGLTDEVCFCPSGIYTAQTDKNTIYGDSENAHSNLYRLGFDEGETVFAGRTRIEGAAKLASKAKPLFVTQNNDDTLNFRLVDSLLKPAFLTENVKAEAEKMVEGSSKIFLLDGEISVLDSATGEFLGSFTIPDEKLFLYNDNRIIGFSEEKTETAETAEQAETGENAEADETAETGETAEGASNLTSTITMNLYDITETDNVKLVSTETIENADPSMFSELEPEMGDGVVILPVKIVQEDGSLYIGKYGYSESSYYGLKFTTLI